MWKKCLSRSQYPRRTFVNIGFFFNFIFWLFSSFLFRAGVWRRLFVFWTAFQNQISIARKTARAESIDIFASRSRPRIHWIGRVVKPFIRICITRIYTNELYISKDRSVRLYIVSGVIFQRVRDFFVFFFSSNKRVVCGEIYTYTVTYGRYRVIPYKHIILTLRWALSKSRKNSIKIIRKEYILRVRTRIYMYIINVGLGFVFIYIFLPVDRKTLNMRFTMFRNENT